VELEAKFQALVPQSKFWLRFYPSKIGLASGSTTLVLTVYQLIPTL